MLAEKRKRFCLSCHPTRLSFLLPLVLFQSTPCSPNFSLGEFLLEDFDGVKRGQRRHVGIRLNSLQPCLQTNQPNSSEKMIIPSLVTIPKAFKMGADSRCNWCFFLKVSQNLSAYQSFNGGQNDLVFVRVTGSSNGTDDSDEGFNERMPRTASRTSWLRLCSSHRRFAYHDETVTVSS
ncbi:hypothetical protein ACMFMG_009562 [Clarireedia jacksonii]